MAEAVGAILAFAVGVAISPIPIVAVILVLFSARARANGLAFTVGWMLGLGAVSLLAYALSDAAGAASDETASDSVSLGKLLIGVAFLLLALRYWRSRPATGDEPAMPAWMSGIDSFTAGRAFSFGLVLGGINPKNLMLSIAAGTAVAQLGPTTAEAAVAWSTYVFLASSSVAGPVVYSLVAGERAAASLGRAKPWLVRHSSALMTVLLVVLGALLIGDALPAFD